MSPLIYLTGGQEEWLDWAKGILSADGYTITDSQRRADLVLVGEHLLDTLGRIPKKFRRKALVFSLMAPRSDGTRRAFKMGFYDIVGKPYDKDSLLKAVADAIAEVSPRH